MILDEIKFEEFLKVDIRVGEILEATINKKAKKSAYILKIDFGSEIGIKTSSAQITQNYTPKDLIGKQICAVVNFAPLRVGGVKSEVLVLAVVCKKNGTVLITPDKKVLNGEKIA